MSDLVKEIERDAQAEYVALWLGELYMKSGKPGRVRPWNALALKAMSKAETQGYPALKVFASRGDVSMFARMLEGMRNEYADCFDSDLLSAAVTMAVWTRELALSNPNEAIFMELSNKCGREYDERLAGPAKTFAQLLGWNCDADVWPGDWEFDNDSEAPTELCESQKKTEGIRVEDFIRKVEEAPSTMLPLDQAGAAFVSAWLRSRVSLLTNHELWCISFDTDEGKALKKLLGPEVATALSRELNRRYKAAQED